MQIIFQQNLEILTALNDSFYTKKNHLSISVNGDRIAIPSFLSLENKIDAVQQDLENLLNAPKTGEAFMYFDGTTQKMELSGYASAPAHIDIPNPVSQFNVETNNIFKDFMSPNPYVKLDISSISNNIKHVDIKKISFNNEELISTIKTLLDVDEESDNPSYIIQYTDLYKLLLNYTKDLDYVEYDTIKRLPTRHSDAYGTYNIQSIDDNYTDSDFNEHYVLVLDRDLNYYVNNGTIERSIKVGDLMITNNDKVQMVVEEVYSSARTIKVKILYGGYADLCDLTSNNVDLYQLKFYKPADFNRNKYIEVPLEEDEYVCIFVSAINDTTNIESSIGAGLYIDTDLLVDESGVKFREYYNKYVNNIGDALFAITRMMDDDSQIEKLNKSGFETLRDYKPILNEDNITVTQINKHLNDSSSVQAIRNLYNQKTTYKNELDDVQASINQVNNILADISFDDTTNTRLLYENQLTDLNAKKKELTSSINSLVNEIAENANNSDIPIENAKYHIRGFADISGFEKEHPEAKVIRIDVEYRYKNKNKFIGNAETIGPDSYIYSDWNKMDSIYRKTTPVWDEEDIRCHYEIEPLTENVNVISFNQIDIPITQGENVDIRIRYIYNLGYPFVEFASDWSDIYNQAFPEEYLTNVEILDIITENNDDVKKNAYIGLMDQYGLLSHITDSIQDQTILYRHSADYISSGFYTAERRIIPLSDKLRELSESILDLNSEVYGSISDNLVITLSDNVTTARIRPNITNTFKVVSYKDNDNKIYIPNEIWPDAAGTNIDIACSQLTLNLYNDGEYPLRLHTLFPGDYNLELSDETNSRYSINDYILPDGTGGVYMQFDDTVERDNEGQMIKDNQFVKQRYNQFIYFRTHDISNNGQALYAVDVNEIVDNDKTMDVLKISNNKLLGNEYVSPEAHIRDGKDFQLGDSAEGKKRYASVIPYPGKLSNICCEAGQTFIKLNPGESIVLPITFYYWFEGDFTNSQTNPRTKLESATRTIEFDLRTSLFSDPISFKVNLLANEIDNQNTKTLSEMDLTKLPSYNITSLNATKDKVFKDVSSSALKSVDRKFKKI